MRAKPRSLPQPPTLPWSLARRKGAFQGKRAMPLQTQAHHPAKTSTRLVRPTVSEGILPIEFGPPRPTKGPDSKRSLTHHRSYSWTRCKALADPEAIPFLEPSRAPLEQESRLMLQCLWSRSIIAIIASLPAVAPNEEIAISLLQAMKASAAIAILTVPRDHSTCAQAPATAR